MNLKYIFNKDAFIKNVVTDNIQFQDVYGEIIYTVNYKSIKTVTSNNRFVIIYTNTEEISLQFITNEDSTSALNKLMSTLNDLKNNTYVYNNNNLTVDIYDPDTFIVEIIVNEFSIKLRNNKFIETETIIADKVTSIYAIENIVKIKTEYTDNIINLTFENSTEAILGAKKLRESIKNVLDRALPTKSGVSMHSFSKVFESQSTWTIDPDINFDMDSFVIQYYEYVCPDGGSTCNDSDKVKQECKGLVEITGNEETRVLDYVTICFNKPISGKAIILSK